MSDELYLSMTGDHLYSNKSDISEESLQMAGKVTNKVDFFHLPKSNFKLHFLVINFPR